VIGDRAYAGVVVNGKDVCMVVDTGSPIMILDEAAAKAAGISASGDVEQVCGLGAGKSVLAVGTAKSLALGGLSLKDVPVRMGALPIFATLRAGKPIGILGNDVLSRFTTVRLDFERSELTLVR